MKITLIISCFIILLSCQSEANQPVLNKAKSEAINDQLVDTISPQEEDDHADSTALNQQFKKNMAHIYFELYLERLSNRNDTVSIDDFLAMALPSEDDQLALAKSYSDSLPFYPDELYCLLLESFSPSPTLDSIGYYPETNSIISFRHGFRNGIMYQFDDLESGSGIECTFPTNNDSLVRSFMSKLYADVEDHTWHSDSTFGPIEDGEPGCYINLKQEPESTAVSVYCGC